MPDEAPDLADAGFPPRATAVMHEDRARLLAATLDIDPAILASGRLPIPWHWTVFTSAVATAALGDDGHPRRRPEVAGYPSRMWAGGRVVEHRPLRFGLEAHRSSTIVDTVRKATAGGPLWIVTVHHTFTQDGTVCIEEDQDLVFRGASPVARSGADLGHRPDVAPDAWCEATTASPVQLFRYSALTFNSHRIHYDRPYATGVEAYEELVVHGPLTATLLADGARRHAGRAVRSLEYRARAPLFAGRPIWLTGAPDDGATLLTATRHDHVVAMTARAVHASD